ncbi:GNAT family N-acetyltransferase [Chitinophaga nivalis]|uniref:GNAT family N-acetyltransferase n=1 Tax=Chitinophaga nivalis TaxID=2991709 RepID=A0ABT3IH13_9BACT|nr:GNAT family protein [Chitinophaga nivalis]MCW3467070.1 GNAT family N-acetyltransferase [Chitinophaga nivalis]MCW3483239.1 GNAT family N-acetyltransferase [Chitinophaga nivalis]
MSTILNDITTPRLVLRLMNKAVMESCLAGELAVAGNLLGAVIPPALLLHPSSLTYSLKALAHDPLYAPWSARAIILPDKGEMIGLIRFHGAPGDASLLKYAPHAVEVGYEIYPPYRRQGYAKETLGAVMAWAQATYDVHAFVASVSPSNIPSRQLVAGFGFVKTAEIMDDVDGLEYVYLRYTE